MAKGLTSTWPEIRHRLCIWHIFQNAAIHLNHVFENFKQFANDFSRCLYDFDEEEDFISEWDAMLKKYDLEDNDLLNRMFKIKEKWALVYGRETFCADMTTTQRSESMNSVIKRYVTYKNKFHEFFNHFERLVDDRRYKELKADFRVYTSTPVLPFDVDVLKQAASVYTPEVFKWFETEWGKSHNCGIITYSEVGTLTEYKITPKGRKNYHMVRFDSMGDQISCSCKKYEFSGILCSHSLKVFNRFVYTQLVTKAAQTKETYKIAKEGLLKILDLVDARLHQEGSSNEMSNTTKVCNPTNNTTNASGINIKAIKRKARTISGKRLRSSLEKATKRRRSTRRCHHTKEMSSHNEPIGDTINIVSTRCSMQHHGLQEQRQQNDITYSINNVDVLNQQFCGVIEPSKANTNEVSMIESLQYQQEIFTQPCHSMPVSMIESLQSQESNFLQLCHPTPFVNLDFNQQNYGQLCTFSSMNMTGLLKAQELHGFGGAKINQFELNDNSCTMGQQVGADCNDKCGCLAPCISDISCKCSSGEKT
ncbi:protein FAR1-RELATED SEQUENCE 5-like [Coffea eugenioides]|uniref:protein FAR1-RELATED SEQUENCE 5-like n=1 Tax=Coffea eugenioides TaxID=49369 RepID=UPI000F60A4F8|nr:protein FAR1-RELATED SEQUENCE 5-like [Coffea eugenioides]